MSLDFYFKHYTALFAPLLSLMRHGVKVDLDRAAAMRQELLGRCTQIQDQLAEIAGAYECVCGHEDVDHHAKVAPVVLTKTGKPKKRQPKPTYPCIECKCVDLVPKGQPLHADVDLSSTRVVDFLYTYLGFPKLRNRGEESPTGNEIAVRRCLLRARKWADERHSRVPKDAALWKRNPDLAIEACTLILEHREKFKTSGFLDEAKIDEDGRFRSQYKFTTTTGRLASRKNPYGTGGNAQNIHRDVRDCFIPDDGCVFLEPDLSQAEKRVVDVLTGDPILIANAQSKPWEFDAHTHNAAIIFAIPVDQVTKEQRYLGKRAVHASNYGMHGKRLSEALLVDGIARTADECQRMIDAYLHACSAIPLWQREVRKTIMRTGQLTNSWGRTLSFKGERMNDDTYRAGYAFIPQSEVGDLLNQWGLVPLWNWLRKERMRSRINAQIHDALLISARPDEAYDIACFVAEHLERPRTYNGVDLSIPVEFALSMTWKKDHELKRLPDRQTFNTIVRELMNGRGRKAA